MDNHYTNLQKEQQRKYNAKQGARNVASRFAKKIRKKLSNKKINSLVRKFTKNSYTKDKKIETLTNQYAEVTENNEYLNSQITNLDKQITDLDVLLTDQESDLFSKDLAIQNNQNEILSLQNKLDSQQEVIDSNTKSLEKNLIKITKLNTEKDMLENRIDTIRKKNEELKAQKYNSKRSSNQKNTELETVTEVIKKNDRQIKSLKEELEKATTAATEFYKISEDELRILRDKNKVLLSNKKELQQKIVEFKKIIQEKDAEINSIDNNNGPLNSIYKSSYSPLSNEKKRQKRVKLKAEYIAKFGYTNNSSFNKKKIKEIVNKKMKEYEYSPTVTSTSTSTSTSTNPVMTAEASTQTSILDTNIDHLNRKIQQFKELLLEFNNFKSDKIQTIIDNLDTLIVEETNESIKGYIDKFVIPFRREKLDKQMLLLKLYTKKINAVLELLKQNFYGFSPKVNSKFTTFFEELYTNFQSMLESYNVLTNRLEIAIKL